MAKCKECSREVKEHPGRVGNPYCEECVDEITAANEKDNERFESIHTQPDFQVEGDND